MINQRKKMCTLLFRLFVVFSMSQTIVTSLKAHEEIYKFSNNIIPQHYNLHFIFDVKSGIKLNYEGKLDIYFEVKRRTNRIELHNNEILLINVQVKHYNIDLPSRTVHTYNGYNVLNIIMENDLNIGAGYMVHIEYLSKFKDAESCGIFKLYHKNEYGQSKFVILSKFEPHFAHWAFPCLDEPKFKATFNLTLTYPATATALTNTLSVTERRVVKGLATENFATTPYMSPHSLAFVIMKGTVRTNNTVRVWAKSGTENQRSVLLRYSDEVLRKFEEFTAITRASFNMKKVDLVAVPSLGTYVNSFGLFVMQQRFYLDYGENTGNSHVQYITIDIAEKFARLWFGNLVTLKRTADYWFDDALASYFGYFITNMINPTWYLNKQFVTDVLQTSLHIDGYFMDDLLLQNNNSVNSSYHIKELYSNLNVYRGSSLIRMIYYILGNSFKNGIQKYLKDKSYKLVQPKHLVESFDSQSPKFIPKNLTMLEILQNWITKPGYPVITVVASNNTITFSQKRFLYANATDNTTWYVPISFSRQSKLTQIVGTRPKYWLTPDGNLTIRETLNDGEWIIVNNLQTGVYRVNYEKKLWDNIASALKYNFKQVVSLNRAQIIDDIFNLARAGQIPYKTVLNLADYLRNETNYSVWSATFNVFSYLIKQTQFTPLGRAIERKLSQLMDNFYKSVPLSKIDFNNQIYTLKQILAYKWACRLGKISCIQMALRRFNSYKNNIATKKPHSNFQKIIYCTALRNSSNIENDWNFLWDQLIKSNSLTERENILYALGCATNSTILQSYLEKSLSDDVLKYETYLIFHFVYARNLSMINSTYEFFKENHQKIGVFKSGTLNKIVRQFRTHEQIDEFHTFISNISLPEMTYKLVQYGIQKARINLDWKEKYADQLNGAFINSAD